MNKATEWIYEDIELYVFGYLLMAVIEKSPELYKRCKELDNCINGFPDPTALVKYAIRRYWRFPKEDGSVSLFKLKSPHDPLEVVTFWKFNGQFGYDKEEEAYVSMGNNIEKSRVMKKIYNQIEERRVEEKWEEAKKYLATEDGEPTLSY